ncbi:MAG: DUF996 domain-containing protein [bacterium]|nr:DUF996 domain-containing protein [bacterium]
MKEEKFLGGIGAILYVLGFIPNIGIYLEIIGLILILVAISKLAKRFNNREIYSKFLIGFIAGVISAILIFISVGVLIIEILGEITGMASESTLSKMSGSFILMLIAVYVLSILSAYNWRKSFNIISSYTNIGQFNTAGNLLFWGAITSIILVGILIAFIGSIFLAVAFFNLPEKEISDGKDILS